MSQNFIKESFNTPKQTNILNYCALQIFWSLWGAPQNIHKDRYNNSPHSTSKIWSAKTCFDISTLV
jgi:hypothetical protein